ncbi:hypothetical protein [Photorhabdus hainanensis]|nr:hypothetical protein [Photorhabdus hainanensis]
MTTEIPPLSPTSEAEIDSFQQAVSQKTQCIEPQVMRNKKK